MANRLQRDYERLCNRPWLWNGNIRHLLCPKRQRLTVPAHQQLRLSALNSVLLTPLNLQLSDRLPYLQAPASNYVVTDINGDILFKVEGPGFFSMHARRVLKDAAGNPILTLNPKFLTAHDRWQVFTGDISESSDLIFTVKRSSVFQFKTKLDVFLANNNKKDVCDFKVKASFYGKSCVIYAGVGQSSTIVAQMHKKNTFKSMLIGKDKFMVTVNPNIDYAFIVALIVILDGIHTRASGSGGGGSDS
ncbi:hypothetical protein COLO4_06874 [Corchorus olitorius]|uniref:Uncharacterized protein n=1 Tax=Corchorus olitorius TaxID=93759 RepID=A0A1R3KLN2_9ROSI|nr:hypothetical protein COLO4_06874 [Corchorus olitorius]